MGKLRWQESEGVGRTICSTRQGDTRKALATTHGNGGPGC
jgi:hypothetical protein